MTLAFDDREVTCQFVLRMMFLQERGGPELFTHPQVTHSCTQKTFVYLPLDNSDCYHPIFSPELLLSPSVFLSVHLSEENGS